MTRQSQRPFEAGWVSGVLQMLTNLAVAVIMQISGLTPRPAARQSSRRSPMFSLALAASRARRTKAYRLDFHCTWAALAFARRKWDAGGEGIAMANGATATATAQAPQAHAKAKSNRKRGGITLLRWLTESWPFQTFILLCIIANAAILGYDAHFGEQNPYHALIEQWNMYFLYIFTAELALEFLAQGPARYFRSGWNIFDILVVGLSYVAVNPAISALRTLRVVRVFRLISAVPQMRRVVEALFGAMPGILATFAILAIVFYIGAVMATTLFHNEPGFRDLGESALKLFALTQFDGWGDTINQLQPNYPWAWVFIMGFTIVAAFAVLNLFVGVIVEAVQAAPREEIKEDIDELEGDVENIAVAQEDAAAVQQHILDEVRALRAEIASLRGNAPPPA